MWWINSEDAANLKVEYAELAVKLGRVDEKAKLDTKVNATREWLDGNEEWLLVFDNVEKPEVVKPYLGKGGHNLVTSRYHAWDDIATELKVEVWLHEESIAYLEKRLKNTAYALYSENVANNLAEEMSDLPLALTQAASYIRATECKLSEYLEIFKDEREKIMAK